MGSRPAKGRGEGSAGLSHQQVTHAARSSSPSPGAPTAWSLPLPSTGAFSTCDFSPLTLFLNTCRRGDP